MARNQHTPTPPVARVVLLGASNLRLGLPVLIEHARRALGSPLEFYVAQGFGRSYGRWSSIPGRALPGIVSCGLWDALKMQPALPTFALVTDVGNDLLYGADAAQLIEWVSECFTRLNDCDAQIVLTELPISSISGLGRHRYQFFRTIFFPQTSLPLAHAIDRAIDTNLRLKELGKQENCPVIAMQQAWYGVDPIHVRRRYRSTAWQLAVDAWQASHDVAGTPVLPLKNRLSVETAAPEEWRLLGRRMTRSQPCVVLGDGSSLALY